MDRHYIHLTKFWELTTSIGKNMICFHNVYQSLSKENVDRERLTIWHMLSDSWSASSHLLILMSPLIRWTNVLSSATPPILTISVYSSKALTTLPARERLSIKEVYVFLLAAFKGKNDGISSCSSRADSNLPALIKLSISILYTGTIGTESFSLISSKSPSEIINSRLKP